MRTIIEILFEDYVFDPSIIDLVLWFPHLSWSQFFAATISVLTWSWISDRLWRAAMKAVRRKIISVLFPNLRNYVIFGVRLGRILEALAR